jgi:hypothetical protein
LAALFVSGRLVGLIFLIIMIILTYYYVNKEEKPYLRRVPAIEAIDEVIKRSVEIGRPVIASPGIADLGGVDYWTVAGLSILSYVAHLCARYDIKLVVPLGGSNTSYSTMEIARDLVQTAYIEEGNPERYNIDNLPFLSGRQFAWASAYVGLLIRDKPGTNIMMGHQAASAMYISEVANSIGAMQVGGTSYLSNVACLAASLDYLVIGEEMIAAGAYLSGDPAQIASVKTQDVMKALMVILIVLGVIALAFGSNIMESILTT